MTWVQSRIEHMLLPAWFSLWALYTVLDAPDGFGFDVRLYQIAARAWLEHGNPWAVGLSVAGGEPMLYAGPPETLLPFLLVGWVPQDVLVLTFGLASAATALWVIRRLGLPAWWVLYPPIVQGLWVGNLSIFVIALLVSGGTIAGGVATVIKVYAAVPLVLLGRWRPLVVAGAVIALTFPFLPWGEFLAQYPTISASLVSQAWSGSPDIRTTPLVTVGAAMGLILLGRKRAAWLAVPVLWPATQLHYAVIALPALSPFLASFAAVEAPGVLGLGVISYSLWVRRDLVRAVATRQRPTTLP